MNETTVKLLYGLIAVGEVAATARLVAKTPEDDAGEVAVCEDHAFLAVNVSRTPTGTVCDGLTTIVSVVVALKICLVHDVHAIVVEHGIHLVLAWIVAATHSVDVGLFH